MKAGDKIMSDLGYKAIIISMNSQSAIIEFNLKKQEEVPTRFSKYRKKKTKKIVKDTKVRKHLSTSKLFQYYKVIED